MPYKKVLELCAPWTQNKRLKLSTVIENDEDPHSLRLFIRSMNEAEVPIQMVGDNVDPAFLQALRLRLAPQKQHASPPKHGEEEVSNEKTQHHEVAIDKAISSASGTFASTDTNNNITFGFHNNNDETNNNPSRRRDLPTSIVLCRQVRWRRAIIDTFDLTIVILSIAVIFANLACAVEFFLTARVYPFYVMTAVAALTSIVTASVFAAFFKEQVLQEWNILLIWMVSVPFASVLPLIAYFMRLEETKLFASYMRSDSQTIKWICRHSLVLLVAFIQSFPQSLFLVMAMIYFQTATAIQIFAVVLSAITVLLRFAPLLFQKLSMNIKVMLIIIFSVMFDLTSILYTCVSILEQHQTNNDLIAVSNSTSFYPLFPNANNHYQGVIQLSWVGYAWFIIACTFAGMFVMTSILSLGIKRVRDTLGRWLVIYIFLSPLAALCVPIALTLKLTIIALLYTDRYYHQIMAAKSAIVAAALLKTGSVPMNSSPLLFGSPQLPDGENQNNNNNNNNDDNDNNNKDILVQTSKSNLHQQHSLIPDLNADFDDVAKNASLAVQKAQKELLEKENRRKAAEDDDVDVDDMRDFDEQALQRATSGSGTYNSHTANSINGEYGGGGGDGGGGDYGDPLSPTSLSQDVSWYSRAKIGAGGFIDDDFWEALVMPTWFRICTFLFATGQISNTVIMFCHYIFFNHNHKPEQIVLFWAAIVCLGGLVIVSFIRFLEAHRFCGILGDLATIQMLLGGANQVSKEQMDVATRAFDEIEESDEDDDDDENDDENDSNNNKTSNDHEKEETSLSQIHSTGDNMDQDDNDQQQQTRRSAFAGALTSTERDALRQSTATRSSVTSTTTKGGHQQPLPDDDIELLGNSMVHLKTGSKAKSRWNFLAGNLFSLRPKKKSEAERLLEQGATSLNDHQARKKKTSSSLDDKNNTKKEKNQKNSNKNSSSSNDNNNNNKKTSSKEKQQPDLEIELSPDEKRKEAEAEERAARLFINTLLDEEDSIAPLERVSHKGHRFDMCRSFTATRVTNGKRNCRVSCMGNSRCTEISRTYLNSTQRNFSITFKVEKFCDDDIAIGLVGREFTPLDLINKQCWSLDNSIAIVFRERMVAPAIFVKNKPLVVLPQWNGEIIARTVSINVLNGFVSFDVNGLRLNCPGLSEWMLSGLFRIGVSLPKKGQSILIKGIQTHTQTVAEKETSKFIVPQHPDLSHPSESASAYFSSPPAATTTSTDIATVLNSSPSFTPQAPNRGAADLTSQTFLGGSAASTPHPSSQNHHRVAVYSPTSFPNTSNNNGNKPSAKPNHQYGETKDGIIYTTNDSASTFASSSADQQQQSSDPSKYLHNRLPAPHNPSNELTQVESLVLPGMEQGASGRMNSDFADDDLDVMRIKKQQSNSEWTLMNDEVKVNPSGSKPTLSASGIQSMISRDQITLIENQEAAIRAKKIQEELERGHNPFMMTRPVGETSKRGTRSEDLTEEERRMMIRESQLSKVGGGGGSSDRDDDSEEVSGDSQTPQGGSFAETAVGAGSVSVSRLSEAQLVRQSTTGGLFENTTASDHHPENHQQPLGRAARSSTLNPLMGQGQRLRAQLLRRQHDDSINVGERDILSEIQSSLGPLGYCLYFAALVALIIVLILVILWRSSSNPITILFRLKEDDFDIAARRNTTNSNTSSSFYNSQNNNDDDDDAAGASREDRGIYTGYLPSGQSIPYKKIVAYDWECSSKNLTELGEDLLAAGYFLTQANAWNLKVNRSSATIDSFNSSTTEYCVRDFVPQLNNKSFVCSKLVQEAWWASVCLSAHGQRPCVVKYMIDIACHYKLSSIQFCPIDFTEQDTGRSLCNYSSMLTDPDQLFFGVIQGDRPLLTLGKKSQLVPINNSNPNVQLSTSSCSFNLQTNVVFTPYSWLVVSPLFEIATITVIQLGVVRLAFFILYKIGKFLQHLRRRMWCGCCYRDCCEGCKEWAGNDQTPLIQQRMHSSMLFDQIVILGERAKNAEFYHGGFDYFTAFGWAFGNHAQRAHRYRVLSWRRICVPTFRGCEWRIAEFSLRRYDLEDPYRYEDVLLVSNDLMVMLMDVPLVLCWLRVIGFFSNVVFAFLAVSHLWQDDGYHAFNVLVVHLINSSIFSGLMFCMWPLTPDSYSAFMVSPLLGPIDECPPDCKTCIEKRREARLESRILSRDDALALADEVHHFELSFQQRLPFLASRLIFMSCVLVGLPHIIMGSVVFPATLMGVAICALVFVYVASRVQKHVTIIVLLFMVRIVCSVILTAAFQSSTNYAALLWFHEGFNSDPNNVDDRFGGGNYFYIVQREFDSRSVMCYIEIIRDSVKNAAGALNMMQIYQFMFGS